eukprot:4588542-Amphidinium_carterae.1
MHWYSALAEAQHPRFTSPGSLEAASALHWVLRISRQTGCSSVCLCLRILVKRTTKVLVRVWFSAFLLDVPISGWATELNLVCGSRLHACCRRCLAASLADPKPAHAGLEVEEVK